MIKSGVYEILNTTNGKRYVGSAVDLPRRKHEHWKELRGNRHNNRYLQNAWNKYGEECFEFSVLEYWELEFLISFEQWWMNMLCAEYNIAPVAGNSLGYKHTDEAKAKMSASAMGKKYLLGYKPTTATREKISAALMGKPKTAETRAKMSVAQKGHKKNTKEVRAKLSASAMGRTFTDETKAKLSASLKLYHARHKTKEN